MAPTSHSKVITASDTQKPAVLVPTAKRALRKSTCPQRSSLRRAVRESLLDLSAVATIPTPPHSRQPLFLPPPTSAPSTTGLVSNATAQRSSLRRALKESMRDVTPIGSLAAITHSPPPTLSLTPPITPGFISVESSPQSSPSSLANTSTMPPASLPTPSLIPTDTRSPLNSTSTPTSISPLLSNKKPRISQKQHRKQLRGGLNYADIKGSKSLGCTKLEKGCEQSEHMDVMDKPDTNGVPTSRKGWYHVRSIINEAHDVRGRLIYFVDWEGQDPRTGIGWPGSWVNSKNVSEAAIREWRNKQNK
ncbi:uncharacterized protein F4812DRAFT_136492 [Daldinia caldariorum]|uniref:uncharacterized protein n=1 Tax=Daldinia caldariorum TaxID=326644 RepID=UPI00200851F9|nr:uncharacterized protein F4812DRAFT_136492 [Daldinia caldariorum]KAI1465203.1 hypothetical protein F4812DRAFT_136492 [Daldinia caldariorum]